MKYAPRDGTEIVVYFSGELNIRPKKKGRAYDSLKGFPHPSQIRWNKHLEYWQDSAWGFEIAVTEDNMMGWMPLPHGIKPASEFYWASVKHEDIYKA